MGIIGIAGMEGIPPALVMFGIAGMAGAPGMVEGCACGPTPGGKVAGKFGVPPSGGPGRVNAELPTPAGNPSRGAGVAGIAGGLGSGGIVGGPGIPGSAGKFVGPMPDGKLFGIAGMPGGRDCGPTPGGSPAGICGKPGGVDKFSATGFNRTKLRLCGKSKVSVPESRFKMSTGFGQFVAIISTRRKFVPTV